VSQPLDDADLVHRAQGGDRSAFADLMRRHERRIYNLAYRMLGTRDDAHDATQEAFLACYRNLGRFRGDSAFGTWLHRIALNACYDALRRRRPAVSLDQEDAPEPAVADHADAATAAADVHRALQEVPDEFRVVLILHELQDVSVEEVAAMLDVPIGTVKSRLFRGRAALGRALTGGSANLADREPASASPPSKPPADLPPTQR
jgi:RNA polymerase sigma-70 factor (ECF subfamily)